MELIPRALIAGLMVQSQVVSTGPVNVMLQAPGTGITRQMINNIWSDVVKEYPSYQSLQIDPSGNGGLFIGAGPEDVAIIQPPLVQVRDTVEGGVRPAGNKVAKVFQSAAHYLPAAAPTNLGVKLVYWAPAPGHDAKSFILSELLGSSADDVQRLAGAMDYAGSAKLTLTSESVVYTLSIEPFNADNSYLFLDLDVQFPGIVDLNTIQDRLASVESFMASQVRDFLDRRSEQWST